MNDRIQGYKVPEQILDQPTAGSNEWNKRPDANDWDWLSICDRFATLSEVMVVGEFQAVVDHDDLASEIESIAAWIRQHGENSPPINKEC